MFCQNAIKEITDGNPLTWMVEVNGLPIDVRMLPITMQRQAYAKGLIPYVPGDKKEDTGAKKETSAETQEEITQDDKVTAGQAFEFLITLDMYDFEVWRRVTVPANITFRQLHFVIQSSFNWLTYHMFDFSVYDNSEEGEMAAMVTEDDESSQYAGVGAKVYPLKTKIRALLPKYRRVIYTYDYGDDWQHYCELVNVIDNYPNDYPVCTDGKGDAPPDDVGGESGYADFLAAIKDKKNPEHVEMKKWGKSQRFEPFDISIINERLKKALSRKI